MEVHPRRSRLIATLALLLAGLALHAHAQTGDAPLPLAPIGGIPIQVVVQVEFDVREIAWGDENVAYEGGWTHTQEGRLLRESGWMAHHDHIANAFGTGRDHCWYDWGQPAGTPHWTVSWASALTLPEPERRLSPISFPLPPIHVAIDGTDALVIYAPPREFTFFHPGAPDDCQSTDPYPAQEQTYRIYYDLDEAGATRPPGARTSYDVVIMDGILMLRLPLARLAAGTTDVAGVNLSGGHEELEWGLRIGLRLASEAGDF